MQGPVQPLPHVRALRPYVPGLQPAGSGWVKLNTNECPYPPSPRVAQALLREIGKDGAALRLYPNPSSAPLRAALAKRHGVEPACVCVGNGSDDILNLLVRGYCGEGATTGFTSPSYSLYPVLVAIQDGGCEVMEFDRTMKLPVDLIAASSARLFLLTSPNAPTGVGFGNAEIGRALSAARGLFVVDEAYAPFASEDVLPLLARHPNLVVVRTFSKAYALAGMRVGYAIADPDVVGVLDRLRDSYNVSRLSQVAALAALEDPEYYARIIAQIRETRDQAFRRLSEGRGWFTYPSQANFLFTEPRDASGRTGPEVAKAACEFLASRRVLVRHFPSHALTAPFLRITVGTPEEMGVLDQSFDTWLKAENSA